MKLKKYGPGDIIFEVFLIIFMVIFLAVTLYPIINTLALSFNDGFDALVHKVHFIPHSPTLDNYKAVFAKEGYRYGAVNTVLRTLFGTLISLVVNAILAYVISRKRFLFKKSFSLFWVITMYVNGGLIPTYITFQKLHLINNFLVHRLNCLTVVTS